MPVRSLFFRSFLSSFTFYYLSRPGARVLVVRRDLIIYYLFFFFVFLVLLLLRCSESRRRQLHHKWPHYGRIPAIVCPDSDEGGLVVGQSPGQPHLPCRVHPQRHHQLVPQWTQSWNWLQYPHARLQRREHHHRTSTCPAIRLVVHCHYHYQLLRRSDDDLIPNANTMICIITDNERRWTGDAIRPQLLRYLSLSGHEHSRKGRARHRLARSPTARPASPNQIRDHYRWVPSSRFMDLAFNLFCFKILSNHHKLCFYFSFHLSLQRRPSLSTLSAPSTMAVCPLRLLQSNTNWPAKFGTRNLCSASGLSVGTTNTTICMTRYRTRAPVCLCPIFFSFPSSLHLFLLFPLTLPFCLPFIPVLTLVAFVKRGVGTFSYSFLLGNANVWKRYDGWRE